MFTRRKRTATELYTYFTKRYPRMPIVLVQDTIDKILARRKAKADALRSRSRLRKVWQEILTPLQAHIQSVLVNQATHKVSNPEYYAFNEKYLRLLRMLRDTMKDHISQGMFPKESLAHTNPANNRATLEGVAWTWWVEPSIRDKVKASYAKLPRTTKTNYRTIFPTPSDNPMPKVRQALRTKITADLTDAELGMKSPHMNDTGREYYAQKIAMLNEALTRLENLPRKTTTPKIYESLFSKDERQTNYPLIYPQNQED